MSDALHSVTEILRRAAVSYAVIGGHAVNAVLEPRFTADIDLTLSATPDEFGKLRETFEREGYRVTREYGATAPSGPDFVRFVSADGSVIVEFQLAKTALQRSLVSRAKRDERGAFLATPEDLLVLKLIANRAKDRVDLEGLVRLPGLDWRYVEDQCREWDVLDRLAALRSIGA